MRKIITRVIFLWIFGGFCDYLSFVKEKMNVPCVVKKGYSKAEPSKDGS